MPTAVLYRDRVLCCIACCLGPATDRIFTVSVYQCRLYTIYMVIGDNYQVAVWFVEVLVSRSRLRAGLSGFYCLDDLHLESPARLGVVNSYLRYELVSYTNYD